MSDSLSRPSASQRPSAIHVHIERLVLDGWPTEIAGGAKSRLESAIVAEVSRRLREGSMGSDWQSGGAFASLQGALRIPRDVSAGTLGSRIGGAIAETCGVDGASKSATETTRDSV